MTVLNTLLKSTILLTGLLAAPAMADDASSIVETSPRAAPMAPTADPPLTEGQALGRQLAAVGRLRLVGDDVDLAVSGVFDRQGADAFRAWRDLADAVAAGADAMPLHRVRIIANVAPGRRGAVHEAQMRVEALRDALVSRGVSANRIELDVRPGALDFEIRFQRKVAGLSLDVGGASPIVVARAPVPAPSDGPVDYFAWD